jgi:malonate decarboxylase delta subunit
MALQQLNFEFKVDNPIEFGPEWSHYGVTGSGDLEILMEKQDLGGAVKIQVVTPVVGFDKVWGLVLEKIVIEKRLGNISIEINDNNATPIVVSMRLRQALAEAAKDVLKEV